MPKVPEMKEALTTWIYPSMDNTTEKPINLNDLMPIQHWLKNYAIHKWRGYVFCPEECVDRVKVVAKKVIEEKYKIAFKDTEF